MKIHFFVSIVLFALQACSSPEPQTPEAGSQSSLKGFTYEQDHVKKLVQGFEFNKYLYTGDTKRVHLLSISNSYDASYAVDFWANIDPETCQFIRRDVEHQHKNFRYTTKGILYTGWALDYGSRHSSMWEQDELDNFKINDPDPGYEISIDITLKGKQLTKNERFIAQIRKSKEKTNNEGKYLCEYGVFRKVQKQDGGQKVWAQVRRAHLDIYLASPNYALLELVDLNKKVEQEEGLFYEKIKLYYGSIDSVYVSPDDAKSDNAKFFQDNVKDMGKPRVNR